MRKINVNKLEEGQILAKSIYSADGQVLLSRGIRLDAVYIERLKTLGLDAVYIWDSRLKDIEIREAVSRETRIKAVASIKKCMDTLRQNTKIMDYTEIMQVVDEIMGEILEQKEIIHHLTDLRTIDDYTFFHSVNVTIISLIIAKGMNFPRERLKQLGVGAILHDLGKIMVDENILNKPGGLSAQEFEKMKMHTVYGFDYLRKNTEINFHSARVAFEHHENINGTGYPKGIKGEEINYFARITAVADVYDALTSDRVYRKKILPHQAFEVIKDQAGTKFDPVVVNYFLKCVAVYPVGTTVELNTGNQGIVIKQNNHCNFRPVIRLINKDGTYSDVDLLQERHIFITKVLE